MVSWARNIRPTLLPRSLTSIPRRCSREGTPGSLSTLLPITATSCIQTSNSWTTASSGWVHGWVPSCRPCLSTMAWSTSTLGGWSQRSDILPQRLRPKRRTRPTSGKPRNDGWIKTYANLEYFDFAILEFSLFFRNKPFTIPIVANQPTWSPPPPGGEMEMMDLSQKQVNTTIIPTNALNPRIKLILL